MASRHLVDAELIAKLDSAPGGFTLGQLQEIRAVGEAAVGVVEDPADVPEVETYAARAPGPAGAPDVPVLVFRPKARSAPRPVVLFIHGGGYFMGTEAMFQVRNRRLARDLDCVVVSIGYRLPPETPHPGPVEDCYAVLAWVNAAAQELGADPARVAVYGESAGGGLAAAVALLARDRDEFPLAYQVLSAPMLDDRTCVNPNPHPFTGEFNWTRPRNHFGWACLLGEEPGGDDVPYYAAPARAKDLSGLPPAFIHLGSLDLFLDEALDYAYRLTRGGVPVELHIYPGVPHSYVMTPNARITRTAEANIFEALRLRFAEAP